MSDQTVCGVIVTYHPSTQMLENIPRALAQVDGLVIVDNGSNPEELLPLQSASRELGFHLLENRDNLGIAEALNQGVLWAKGNGYPWVILFDQDSKITDGFISKMFETWQSHPQREQIASLHPKYVEPGTNIGPIIQRARDGGPVRSITSGALMPLWIFERIGLFASEYFIDEVDTEYCLRIRAAGYLIADSQHAILMHSVGNPRRVSFLGFHFRPTYHSAVRRYYMSRNRISVFRKYFRIFPAWSLQAMYESSRETVKCLLAEDDRARKFRNFLLGTWDGITGKMGKREGL